MYVGSKLITRRITVISCLSLKLSVLKIYDKELTSDPPSRGSTRHQCFSGSRDDVIVIPTATYSFDGVRMRRRRQQHRIGSLSSLAACADDGGVKFQWSKAPMFKVPWSKAPRSKVLWSKAPRSKVPWSEAPRSKVPWSQVRSWLVDMHGEDPSDEDSHDDDDS